MKYRLDKLIAEKQLVSSRSQAESYIKLGHVEVDSKVVTKPGLLVDENAKIRLRTRQQYVSRAGFKLASVANKFNLDFKGKVVLDVGSSTGGFTDYALKHGAKRVIAVDVGSNQLHPDLRPDTRIELHEKTDIRSLRLQTEDRGLKTVNAIMISSEPDIVLIDVSFISLREILPHIRTLIAQTSLVVAMVKPQFEANNQQRHKGVVKNSSMRREILKDFELWVKNLYFIIDKADSEVAGEKGNIERLYLLKKPTG